jgi:arylsulfatase A-like enzyme
VAGAGVGGTALGSWALDGFASDPEELGERPAGSSAARGNIVLIVIDTLRPDHLGCYGSTDARTPNIDALAGESVRFTRAYPEAMPTVPARRAIFAGRRAYPFRDWVPWRGMAKRPGWQPIMPGTETLFTVLRRRGYWTGCVSDNPFLTFSSDFAPFRRGAGHYVRVRGQRGHRRDRDAIPVEEAMRRLPKPLRDERRINKVRQYLADNGRARDDSEQAAARVFRAAARKLGSAARQRPFCLVIDCFDPHEFWAPSPRYLNLYGDPDYRGAEIADVRYGPADYLSRAQVARLQATYKACVTMVDHWLGRFLDRLNDLGLADDTAVALVSDHGVHLAERNWTGKSDRLLHPELIHVPLLLRHPQGRGAGTTSDYFATTVDLAPTLMSLAGLSPPRRFEGVDLAPICEGGQPSEAREFTYGGYSSWSFSIDDRWKLIARNDNSQHALYDLAADPGERTNVASAHPDVVRALWERLVNEIGGRPPRYDKAALTARPRNL